jgi:rhamnosyltransferase
MPDTRVSVIVRTYNSVATVAATFASVRRQSVHAEIVVVDSGSVDDTLALAETHADKVVRLPREQFTYGRALNLGCAHAEGAVHVALSSHCALPRTDWLEIAVQHIADDGASAACGLFRDGERRPLDGPLRADHAYVMRYRHWGFTNHASAWSADAWRRHHFDEELAASEDKEWSWRMLADGGVLVADPRLIVPGPHRRAGGARAYHARLLKELRALEQLRPLARFGLRDAVADLARPKPRDAHLTPTRALGRTRLIEVAARWQAGRSPGRSAEPGGADERE